MKIKTLFIYYFYNKKKKKKKINKNAISHFKWNTFSPTFIFYHFLNH